MPLGAPVRILSRRNTVSSPNDWGATELLGAENAPALLISSLILVKRPGKHVSNS